ncbi:MAG: ferrous iron transport protein B [Oscillospiraceae bacterium]|jgi:ferrous iron transport protein B|nr:ferrous iron transport protein B [Oscillospiraceae bacterium]
MQITIALAGNPNSGKTTLFNALTGANQFVGNWPGVTVEKKEGELKTRKDVTVTDLPGIYSLSPYSPEEVVARNYLIGERPDVILNIIDGTNLERNLFLTTQLTEVGIPVVAAINMTDVVNKNGDKIDTGRLAKELGCAVVAISALKGDGVAEAADAAIAAANGAKTLPQHRFSGCVEHALAHIEEAALHSLPQEQQRFFALKLFERDGKIAGKLALTPELTAHIDEDIRRCEEELDDDSESIITAERYRYIDSIINDCVLRKNKGKLTASDRIDRVLTNRWLALPIFAAVMFLVYFVSVTTVGGFVTSWTNDTLFGEILSPAIRGFLVSVRCADWLQGLILDGIVAGVGAVLGFVPQMLILFLFLAFLEACGYMARIAFMMDRIFRRFGLSGKSFIPILIGTGCGVPGIMASRTIESDRDRRITVMTTTFIPCGAKLPVIALIAGAVFNDAAWVAVSAYFAGLLAIVCSGVILKKMKPFAGDAAPFVMELPAYRMPTPLNVFRSMWERGWSFIKKAGTIILLSAVLVWFATFFGFVDGAFRFLGASEMPHSLLAAAGNVIAPVFSPLGFGDWRPAVASLTGLVAKENVVGTFGVLYGFAEVAEDGAEMWGALAGSFGTSAAAYSFLLFNLLCAPCFAAMGAIRREMNSAKWFWAAVGYQCGLAYAASLCVYQFARLASGRFGAGTAAAFLILGLFLFLLFRKPRRSSKRLKESAA